MGGMTMRLCKDNTTWQWSELADACYILQTLLENLAKKGVSNNHLLSVSDDEEPAVIVSGKLSEEAIQSFLMNAVGTEQITPESSPSDLNDIESRYHYGTFGGVLCTYIFPVRDKWKMIKRTGEWEWGELESMMQIDGVESTIPDDWA